MDIETTVYLKRQFLNKIISASDLCNISRSEIVFLLLNKFMKNDSMEIKAFSPVEYQDADSDAKWRRLHVVFGHDFYERCLDMRKVYKKSVSFLVAIAVLEYLDILIRELTGREKSNDNYTPNYSFIVKTYNKVPLIITHWEFPDKKLLKKLIY